MPGVDTTIGMGAGALVFTLIGEGITTLITGITTLTTLTTTTIIVTITPIIRIDISGRQGSASISDAAEQQRGGSA